MAEKVGSDESIIPVVRFIFRLPFWLPIDPEREHLFGSQRFADPSHANQFPGDPVVHVTIHEVILNDENAPPAIRAGFIQGLAEVLGERPDVEADSSAFRAVSGAIPRQTWIEMAMPFAYMTHDQVEDELLTACFERGLSCLNQMLRAIRVVASRSGSVRPVNKEMLDPVAVALMEDPVTGEELGRNLFILHHRFVESLAERLVPDEEDSVSMYMELASFGHPHVKSREWLERAKDARFNRGDYEEALMCLQVSIERLFVGVVHSTGVDLGLSSTEVSSRVAEMAEPFKSLLTTHMPTIVGGRWSIESERGVLGRYWKHVYLKRNKVTHSGEQVSSADISQAFAVHDEVVDFLIGRLIAQPRKYPRTLVGLLGEPGLRKRGAWNRRIREAAEEFAREEGPYWEPWDTAGRQRQ